MSVRQIVLCQSIVIQYSQNENKENAKDNLHILLVNVKCQGNKQDNNTGYVGLIVNLIVASGKPHNHIKIFCSFAIPRMPIILSSAKRLKAPVQFLL